MHSKDLSSMLLKSVGVVAAASLIAGLIGAAPTPAYALADDPAAPPAVEEVPVPQPELPDQIDVPTQVEDPQQVLAASEHAYSFSIASNNYEFYTDDRTPVISIDTGSIPSNLLAANSGYGFHFVEVDTDSSFYMGQNVLTRTIERFYEEDSKRYRVIFAKSRSAGGFPIPVAQIEDVLAESNQITIKRAPWELSTVGPADHIGNQISVGWTANQSLRPSNPPAGYRYQYAVYGYNLNTGSLKKQLAGNTAVGSVSGDIYWEGAGQDEIMRYQFYVAKDTNPTSVDQLEGIQAVSNVVTVPPRKWGLSLGAVFIESPGGSWGRLIRIPFQSTRSIKYSDQTIFIEDVDTGKIVCTEPAPEHENRTWIHCIVKQDSEHFVGYIAHGNQAVEYASELQGIRAKSNETYPLDVGVESGPGYLRSGMFQNGSNPSTADCQQQCYGDPINAMNGELFENELDLGIEGAVDLNFVRSYSSLRNTELGPFGTGTTFSYNMGLQGDRATLDSSTAIVVKQENGSTVIFSAQDGADGKSYTAPTAVKAQLSRDPATGNYSFTRTKSNDRFTFDSSGRLLRITDRLGNEVSLSYAAGKLSSVTNGVSTVSVSWVGELISSISDGIHSVSYSYDSDKLVSVADSRITNLKQYSYYPDGRVHKITHPNGGIYETTYDDTGRAISQKDPRGGVTSFAYGTGGYTIITLPNGDKTRERYSPLGTLLERTFGYGAANPKIHSYEYTGASELAGETISGDKKISYRYDTRGNLTYLSNPAGDVYRFEYNSQNLLTKTTDPLGRSATSEYSSAGLLQKSVDYGGAVTTYEHNQQGMLTAVKDPLGQESGLSSSYSYSSSQLLSATTDTRGKQTSFVYDAARNPVRSTDALGSETTFSYLNGNPQLISAISYPNGSSESFSYDGAGRKISQTAKDGSVTSYSYDAMDNLLTVATPYGVTSYEYDQNQKLLSITNPKGGKVSYEYNNLGMVTKEIRSDGRTTQREYSAEGLLSAEIDGKGNRTGYGYDGAGRLTQIVDATGKASTFTYDRLGQLKTKTFPSGNWTSYDYSPVGLTTAVNEKNVRKTTYSYDANRNLKKIGYGDGSSESRTYDSEGNLTSTTNREGKSVAYSYDSLNRIASEVKPDQTTVSYGYDSVGNLLTKDYGAGYVYANSYNLQDQLLQSATPEGVITEYGYSARGDLTSRGPPQSKVTYSYSTSGEVESIGYPSGLQIGYSYDSFGNLQEVSGPAGVLASYSYDGNYNLISSSYGNSAVETAEFDGLNRLKKITVASGSAELYSRSLEFNGDSQISKAKTNYGGQLKQSKSYQYSPLNTISSAKDELTSATQEFTYDVVNNIKKLGFNGYGYRANSSEVGSSITMETGIQSYGYDGRGNRTEIKVFLTPSTEYAWSKSDRLTSVNIQQLAKTVNYGYDANGLMVSRAASGSAAESFSWDSVSGSIPTLLEDSSFEYVYGSEATPFLQIEKSTGKATYLHGDERNSVVLATDGTGAALWHRDYNEYGSKFTQTPSGTTVAAAQTRFAYAGEYLDPDTKLYNLRARWYDPVTAGFISVDPAVNLTGEPYSYASGNPLSNTDPLGLWSMKDTTTSVAAVLDGFSPFPFATDLMNHISPGSVDNCSDLYKNTRTVSELGSLLIPGMGPVKAVSMVGKVAVGAGKLLKGKGAEVLTDKVVKKTIVYAAGVGRRTIEQHLGISNRGPAYLRYSVSPEAWKMLYNLSADVVLDNRYSKIKPATIDSLIENGPSTDWMMVRDRTKY